LIIVLVGLRMN